MAQAVDKGKGGKGGKDAGKGGKDAGKGGKDDNAALQVAQAEKEEALWQSHTKSVSTNLAKLVYNCLNNGVNVVNLTKEIYAKYEAKIGKMTHQAYWNSKKSEADYNEITTAYVNYYAVYSQLQKGGMVKRPST